MGLIRLLLLVLVAWLIWWLIRPLFEGKKDRVDKSDTPGVENMVRCAQCGLNLPVGEAIKAGDLYYCSEEHRKLHQNSGPKP